MEIVQKALFWLALASIIILANGCDRAAEVRYRAERRRAADLARIQLCKDLCRETGAIATIYNTDSNCTCMYGAMAPDAVPVEVPP